MQSSFGSDLEAGSAESCPMPAVFARRAAGSLAIVLSLASTVAEAAQAPPILNSPYVCANGITYTVSACKPFGADQWCETTETQNGRLVTKMDSSWSSMTGRLRCTNATTGKQAGAAPSA